MIPYNSNSLLAGAPIVSEDSEVLSLVPKNLQARVACLMDVEAQDESDVENKINLFFLSTSHLYWEIPLKLDGANVVVTGMVNDDGFGDYYHNLNAAELIKSKFPEINVTMAPFFMSQTAPSQVRKPDSRIDTIFSRHFEVSDDLYFLLNNADQIIEMSLMNKSNLCFREIIDDNKDRYRFISEYGCHEGGMGIRNGQLGIMIKDKPITQSVLDIQHEDLKVFLFKNRRPTATDLESYKNKHELFIGYLKKGSYYQTGFIYTIAAHLKSSQKSIDILIPSVPIDLLNLEFLKAQGIGKITSVKIGKGSEVEEVFVGETGKELRLIDPFPLEQTDLHTLFVHTHPLVGCAGDQSFTEVSSFDKLPFFENHYWKSAFYEDLIDLAGTVSEEPQYLQEYFITLYEMYSKDQEKDIETFKNTTDLPETFTQKIKNNQIEIAAASAKLAELISHPELLEELHEFNKILREHYSFAPVLHNIVQKQLVFNSYPNIQMLEQGIKEDYLAGRVSLAEGIHQLRGFIDASL